MLRGTRSRRAAAVTGLALAALVTASACSQRPPDPLESYTDQGDGCQQAISAIAYADDSLKPLGQEPYQEFDEVVRSRVAEVAGQIAVEAKDWPSAAIREQADVVQRLAQEASVNDASPERVRALLEYRGEAARLVLLCRDALGGSA
ncbi:MAG: hypothetical protein ACLGIA_14415 [Actinomycetes bacterium]